MKIINLFRALLIVFSLVIVLPLFACGNETDNNEETTTGISEKNDAVETDAETDTKADESESVEESVTDETQSATETETVTETEKATETNAPEVTPCEHTVASFAYATDGDAATKLAVLGGACTKCGETITKPASFYAAIETVYGNAGDSVVLFQATADSNPAPIMGGAVVEYGANHPNYPANGFSPIPAATPSFGGMMGISGWAGYLGSSTADGAAFRAVDENGNVVVDWTPVTAILSAAGLNLATPAESAVNDILASVYTDATVSGIRFNHIINTLDYSALAGKTVDITLAFATAQGVDSDAYIPYITIEDVAVPAAQ